MFMRWQNFYIFKIQQQAGAGLSKFQILIKIAQSFQNSSNQRDSLKLSFGYPFDSRYSIVHPVNACFQHHQRLRTAWKIEIISICIHLPMQYFNLDTREVVDANLTLQPTYVRYLNTRVYLIEYLQQPTSEFSSSSLL